MKKLEIEPNRQNAKGNAYVVGGIGSALLLGMLLIAALGRVDYGGAITWIGLTLMFGWMFGYLFNFTCRLFRLARLAGPVIVITEEGFTDYWNKQAITLRWSDIDYCDWKETAVTLEMQIYPKKRSARDFWSGIFGAKHFHYQAQYLETPAAEIAKFMLDNVPKNILR